MGAEAESERTEELPFEAALERLEDIVQRLEAGDLPLEEALAAFEEGVGLSRRCARQLDAAERRIEVLLEEGEELRVRPFEGDDAGDESD